MNPLIKKNLKEEDHISYLNDLNPHSGTARIEKFQFVFFHYEIKFSLLLIIIKLINIRIEKQPTSNEAQINEKERKYFKD